MIGRVIGTGSYVPENYYDNYDLEKLVDTSDSWIRERTGIARRHIISEEETTVTMAWKASERALEDAKVTADEIDLIIVATISSNVVLPCTACEVQKQLGAKKAVCFDLNAACTGFLFAYNTAQTYIAAGLATCALVIGAESLSEIVDWTDRGTCILFGDGAGAVVLRAQEGVFLQWFPILTGSREMRSAVAEKQIISIWMGRRCLNLQSARYRAVSGNCWKKKALHRRRLIILSCIRQIRGSLRRSQEGLHFRWKNFR